jgi:multidrug efflux pump subunit AcrA (membrane-fusion protein)
MKTINGTITNIKSKALTGQLLTTFKKYKKVILAVAGILIVSLLSYALYHWIVPKRDNTPPGLAVQTVRVKTIAMPIVIETVGSLLPLHEAKLTAAMTGKVDKILVASGSKVKKGTPLLSIVGIANMLAPFDGFLTDWKVKPGEYVTTGTALIDIVDTDQLSLHYRVPEHYAPVLENDQTITLTVRAFPNREFTGKVNFISPIIDRKTHTVLLHANVNNSDQDLWPGMFAHLRHVLVVENQALVVPESTLNLTMEGYDVLLVKDNKLVRSVVKVGTREKGRVHILAGIEGSDQILLTKTDATKEGTAVVAHDWTGDW